MKWNGNLSLVNLSLDIQQSKNYIEFFFLMFMKKCVICNMEMTHSRDEQLAHCTGLQYR